MKAFRLSQVFSISLPLTKKAYLTNRSLMDISQLQSSIGLLRQPAGENTRKLTSHPVAFADGGVGLHLDGARWCSSASRTGFYAGDDDSDAGSVRRYRVDLPDDEGDNKEMPVKVKETQKRPSLAIVQRSWSCFSFHNKQAVKHGV